jgi:hypothetical protein
MALPLGHGKCSVPTPTPGNRPSTHLVRDQLKASCVPTYPGHRARQEQHLSVRVDEIVTADGAATVAVELQTASDEDFTVPVTLTTSVLIPKAKLVQGYDLLAVPIPPNCKQFLRVYYTVANGPLTAGKFTAALVTGVMSYKHYLRTAVARV